MKTFALQLAWWSGLYQPPDRALLENVILPRYADRRVLFVGTRFYTRKYPGIIPNMVTIDADPRMARYGAREHIVAPIQAFEIRTLDNTFDAVVINGVFGWGVNDEESAKDALRACARALTMGGELVIGFNETRCPRLEMSEFKPFVFPPLGVQSVTVHTPFAEGSHTYQFFTK